MTEHSVPRPSRRRVRPRWLVAGVAAAAVASTAAVAAAAHGGASVGAPTCTGPQRSVQVVVTPELAPVVEQAAAHVPTDAAPGDGCVRVHVVPEDSAAEADAITAELPRRPDAWIPDSSWWAQQTAAEGVTFGADRPSVASSPVVLAVSPQLAARVGAPRTPDGFRALLSAPAGSAALALPDPERDAATSLDLVGLVAAAGNDSAGRGGLAELLRGHLPAPAAVPARLAAVATTPAGLAPASEQAVLVANGRHDGHRVVALYPPSAAGLDYPFLILTRNAADQRVLGRLLAALQGSPARGQLSALGFRAPDGVAPAPAAEIAGALRATNLLSAGTRMLAVIDVSGSMGDVVPGAPGETRLDVTKAAAAQGLSAYTDDTEIGLWIFSRHLSAHADYRALVPIGPLGPRSDGTLGRARLAQALQQVHELPDGGTALYSTVLAAVRQVRRGWDRDRVNSVVLLTDGRDDGEGGPTLSGLLSTLRREADPARPVPVITVGLGGGSDTAALAAISRATGGSSFVSRDGSDAFRVLADAISQRLCRPDC